MLLLRGFSTGATPMIDVQAHAATGICYGLVLSLQAFLGAERFAPSSRVEGMSSPSGSAAGFSEVAIPRLQRGEALLTIQ